MRGMDKYPDIRLEQMATQIAAALLRRKPASEGWNPQDIARLACDTAIAIRRQLQSELG